VSVHCYIDFEMGASSPEAVFTFIPESWSRSSRNTVQNHPGIARIPRIPRIPHLASTTSR
jgi:hypothetical protein